AAGGGGGARRLLVAERPGCRGPAGLREPVPPRLNRMMLDPGLGDGITETVRHSIPLGKPRDFFRMHPDPAYRRLVEIYKHKTEDAIEEENFVFAGGRNCRLEGEAPDPRAGLINGDGA